MDLFLAICEALGLGLAAGLGGPLAWLFIAVMAGLHTGIDTRGTDLEFVGEIWFIAVLAIANVIALLQRRPRDPDPLRAAAAAAVLGAIFGSAAMAAEAEPIAVGAIIGALAGAGAAIVAGDLIRGAEARIEAGAAAAGPGALGLIFGLAGVVVAAFALFLPPSSLVVAVLLATLAFRRRRRAGQKYEGLRILR